MTGSARALLTIAACVVTLEALALATVAMLDFADVSAATVGIGVGAGILLLLYAAGLLVAAFQVWRRRRWACAPLVVAQLIQLLLANDARDGADWVSPVMALTALVVLGCLLAPPVTRALSANGPV